MSNNIPRLGYAVSHDEVLVRFIDSDGAVHKYFLHLAKHPGVRSQDVVIEAIAQDVYNRKAKVSAVGVSIGGHVDPKRGRVVYAPDVVYDGDNWSDDDIANELGNLINLPVFIDNDVNCMLYHHWKQDAFSSLEDIIAVYVDTDGDGVGSGLISGGNMVQGADGGAGEFGHVIVQPTGPRCRCGSRGCMEAVLSVDNFAREINWGRRHEITTMTEATNLVDNGDVAAISAFNRAGRYFGQGLAILFNIFNPALVIVGSRAEFFSPREESEAAKIFQDAYHHELQESAFYSLKEGCSDRVRIERLDTSVAASGAGLMAADRVRT